MKNKRDRVFGSSKMVLVPPEKPLGRSPPKEGLSPDGQPVFFRIRYIQMAPHANGNVSIQFHLKLSALDVNR